MYDLSFSISGADWLQWLCSLALPEGVVPLFLSSKTQEIFGVHADIDVTAENPMKIVGKEHVLQDLYNRAAISDFHPVKPLMVVSLLCHESLFCCSVLLPRCFVHIVVSYKNNFLDPTTHTLNAELCYFVNICRSCWYFTGYCSAGMYLRWDEIFSDHLYSKFIVACADEKKKSVNI